MLPVAVIIPVYNDATNLRACLQAVQDAAGGVECIVVDDGSTDDSGTVAGNFGCAVIRLEKRSGPAAARNAGAAAAHSDILLFIDADVCVHSDTVGRAARALENDAALDGVIGAYDDSPAAPGFVSRYRNLLHCYTHRIARPEASTFWCGCGAVRRKSFFAAGGFDETYTRPSVEDIEFGYRLRRAGGRIALDPQMQVRHRKRWTFTGMVRSDIFDRALPWTELIWRYRDLPDDLNVSWPARATAALLISAAALFPWLPLFSLGALFSAVWLNRGFYGFLRRRRGLIFALRAVPLHLLYFVYSSMCFAFGSVLWYWTRTSRAQADTASTN